MPTEVKDNTSTKPQAPAQQQEDILAKFRADLQHSRYVNPVNEAIRDARRLFELNDEQLVRFGRCLVADLGRVSKEPVKGIKLGEKLNKEGQLTVKEIGDSIKIYLTNSLQLLKLVSVLNQCTYWGLDSQESTLKLFPKLNAWLNNEPEPEG